MQENLHNRPALSSTVGGTSWINRVLSSVILERLSGIKGGWVRLHWRGEQHILGDQEHPSEPIDMHIHDDRFFSTLATRGSIGAGESFMDGHWTTSDLEGALLLVLNNYEMLETMEGGLANLSKPLFAMFHKLRDNTVSGSKKNIAAHYDLSNDFFELMLDETMMYSSGIFASKESTMYDASILKLDRICKKLDIGPTDHVLEIGTGWGGFAIYAAKTYGCEITTTTISQEQYDLAQSRIRKEGLEDKIHLLLKDYRDLEGTYDKIVSIEMIEAVGHQFYESFFKVCQDRLKPEGSMLIQAITIADQHYAAARDSVDFIKRYIFPGSCIPSITALADAAKTSSDLKLFHLEDIGDHYATTLRKWRETFFDALPQVKELGFDDRFIKMWDFYLCYCIAGFVKRHISDVHMVMIRPDSKLNSPT